MKMNSDTVAVITGGASGIGLGLAESLAARGARIMLTDLRAEALSATADRLRSAGVDVAHRVVDVSDRTALSELAAETLDRFGHVDLLCNNAGSVSPGAATWEQTPETWRRMIDVKLLGVVNGVSAFVPHMIERGRGHVLNTASSGGLAPLPQRSPYSATMHAVVGLTETLELELKTVGPELGATVLCPGLVDTPIGENSAELGLIQLPTGTPRSIRDIGPALTPREVGEAAVHGIECGLTYVAPGHGVTERARARVAALLADLDAAVHPIASETS